MKKVLAMALLVAFAGMASAEVSKSTEVVSAPVAVVSSTAVPNPLNLDAGWKPLGTRPVQMSALVKKGEGWSLVLDFVLLRTDYVNVNDETALAMVFVLPGQNEPVLMAYGNQELQKLALKVNGNWQLAKQDGLDPDPLKLEAVLDDKNSPKAVKFKLDTVNGPKELVVKLKQ